MCGHATFPGGTEGALRTLERALSGVHSHMCGQGTTPGGTVGALRTLKRALNDVISGVSSKILPYIRGVAALTAAELLAGGRHRFCLAPLLAGNFAIISPVKIYKT